MKQKIIPLEKKLIVWCADNAVLYYVLEWLLHQAQNSLLVLQPKCDVLSLAYSKKLALNIEIPNCCELMNER